MEPVQQTVIEPAVLVLLVANLALGLGCAVPLARVLAQARGSPARSLRCFVLVVGVYLVESVALTMGMGIPVLNVGLALVWAVVLSRWLLHGAQAHQALRLCWYWSVYSSLPAVSFISVPVLVWLAGGAVLSPQAGEAFGIPPFFPWPVCTILGFYATCAFGALGLKTGLTVGGFKLLARPREATAATMS